MKETSLAFNLLCLFSMMLFLQCKKWNLDQVPNLCTADFTVENEECMAPCEVMFQNTSEAGDSFMWSFGDNNTSTEINPSHTYQSAGTYTVTLTTSCDTVISISKTVTILNNSGGNNGESPIADFFIKNKNCIVPCEVMFINNSSFADQFLWDFGDGTVLEWDKSIVTHIFQNIGTFEIKLQATKSSTGEVNNKKELVQAEFCGSLLIDELDGQTYNTIKIGTQCWMAENLNVGEFFDTGGSDVTPILTNNGIIEKICYDDNPENCEIYGGLYEWEELMNYNLSEGGQGICPCGWHIPTDQEFKILEKHLGMSNSDIEDEGWRGFDEGNKLKSIEGCHAGINCATSGFEALLGGYRSNNGVYMDFDILGIFATSSAAQLKTKKPNETWGRVVSTSQGGIFRQGRRHGLARSVRCIKN